MTRLFPENLAPDYNFSIVYWIFLMSGRFYLNGAIIIFTADLAMVDVMKL